MYHGCLCPFGFHMMSKVSSSSSTKIPIGILIWRALLPDNFWIQFISKNRGVGNEQKSKGGHTLAITSQDLAILKYLLVWVAFIGYGIVEVGSFLRGFGLFRNQTFASTVCVCTMGREDGQDVLKIRGSPLVRVHPIQLVLQRWLFKGIHPPPFHWLLSLLLLFG